MEIDQDDLVAIIGAGTMGAGIAQCAAMAGHRVVVFDPDDAALQRGSGAVGKALTNAVTRGNLDNERAAVIADRISWSSDVRDLHGGVLAIEAIVESVEAKARLYARLAGVISPSAILASNTSSLSITELAATTPSPERFVGMHFFNPAPVMKLVEIVSGERTLPAVTKAMSALMRAWGKRAVIVRDVPGFIVNRVARPYYAEAFVALSEGISADTIDRALMSSGGFRMGPLALADLIGHDVNYAVSTLVFEAYERRTRFRPQPAQKALVDAGRLGRKSGRGVYEGTQVAISPPAPPSPTLGTVRVSASGGTSVKLFREAGLVCSNSIDLPHGVVEVDGTRFAMTDGRPLAARDDVDVLADVSRDFAVANTIVLTARNARAAEAVTGLVQATGRSVLLVPDRPGMIVLRTLAQLANSAADAVADEVASIAAIDEAMVYGANHPEGPLHWAERAGLKRIAQALNHIAASTGDEMYRPAALLARA